MSPDDHPTPPTTIGDQPLDRRAKRRRRRQVVVDRELQFGLAARAAGFTILVVSALGVALFIPLIEQVRDGGDSREHSESAVVLLYLHERFWPFAIIAVVLSILLSILTSHRIAGPLVRVKRNLLTIASGGLPGPLTTRRKDFMRAEVRALNAASAALADRHAHCSAILRQLRSATENVRPLIHRSEDPWENSSMTSLENGLEELGQLLGVDPGAEPDVEPGVGSEAILRRGEVLPEAPAPKPSPQTTS